MMNHTSTLKWLRLKEILGKCVRKKISQGVDRHVGAQTATRAREPPPGRANRHLGARTATLARKLPPGRARVLGLPRENNSVARYQEFFFYPPPPLHIGVLHPICFTVSVIGYVSSSTLVVQKSTLPVFAFVTDLH